MTTGNGIERVSMATFEAHVERSAKLIRWMIVGWAVSVVMLGFVLMVTVSYETKEVTTTTTSEIAQSSQDNGSNIYAGGDYYGNPDNQDYHYDGEEDAPEGPGGNAEGQ